MDRLVKAFLATAAVAGTMAASAADRPWHPYREVCERLGLIRFFDLPEGQRDQLRLLFKVGPGDQGAPLILTIDSAAHPIRVAPDAEGLIDFPFDRQLLAENPDVLINLPAGAKASFTLDLRPRAPSELQLDYVRFMGSIPQANAFIRREAGLLRLVVPTLRKLILRYERADGQQVSVGAGADAKVFRVSTSAQIVIPFEEALFSRNVGVTISALPQSAEFSD